MFLLSRIMSFPYLIYELWEATAAAGMNGWWAIYPSEMSSEYIQAIYLVRQYLVAVFIFHTVLLYVVRRTLSKRIGSVREKS